MKTGSKVISIMISVFYVVILAFVLLVITDISKSDIFVPAVIFGCISYVCLFTRGILGNLIQKAIGAPMALTINILTALYVFVVFILSVGTYSFISVNIFILLNLILTFIYFCIVSLVIIVGNKK